MPLIVATSDLQPGMRLAEPIIQQNRVLLAANRELTQHDINALRRLFPQQRMRVADPILDALTDFEDDSRERDVAELVRSKIGSAMAEMQERFSSRASATDLQISGVQAAVAGVIAYLEQNPVSAALVAQAFGGSGYLPQHTGNVFYLSMLLGATVRDYVVQERMRQTRAKGMDRMALLDLTPLGLGAMFMDLGMLPLQSLYAKKQPLTDAERKQVREHPLVGAGMLPESFSPVARSIVKTHHENVDGSGYPAGLTRDKLHIFARIVRITDAFDAATATHTYKNALSPPRALWEMTAGPYREYYDPVLVRVFARLIQPFPIGAKLRLTDGRYAVVVKYNRKSPFQPYVLIAFDRDDNRLLDSKIDGPFGLHERTNIHLAFWGEEDLSYIYQSDLDHPAPVRAGEFASLFDASYP